MNEPTPLMEILELNEIKLIDQKVGELIDSIAQKTGVETVSVMFGVWSFISYHLNLIHKKFPSWEVQNLMNRITLHQNSFINKERGK